MFEKELAFKHGVVMGVYWREINSQRRSVDKKWLRKPDLDNEIFAKSKKRDELTWNLFHYKINISTRFTFTFLKKRDGLG